MNKRIYLPRNFSIYDVGRLWSLIIFISLFIVASGMNSAGLVTGEDFTIYPQDTEKTWEIIQSDLEDPESSGQGFPPVWDVPVNTGTVHGYIIMLEANPRLNDIPLKAGDWMGGFYLDDDGNRKCGGARMWTDTSNVILTLFGNDTYTPVKDGFSGGELIEFRIFLWETQKEYIVSLMSYYVGPGWVSNGRWYPTSLSQVLDMQALTELDFFINPSENPICINNTITLSAEELIGSGGPYTFDWSSEPPGFNHTVQNPPPVELDVTTMFSLTVTDPYNTSSHQLTVIVHEHPEVSAGQDATICANETIMLSGASQNALNIEWSSSGDGVFADQFNLNTVYTPGESDIANGSVVLTLSADPFSPCDVSDSDDLHLSIIPLPTVAAGEDASACGDEPITITASATNYSTVQWTTNGSGTFSQPNNLTTQYIPSQDDINSGGVVLTVCVEAVSGCIDTKCDQLTLTFHQGPSVVAPNIRRRCEGQTISISANTSNSIGVLWTTQGDGTFNNPNSTSVIYTPGPNDIENSGTIVTVEALAIAPCEVSATADVIIFIQKLPRINSFGPNTDFACKDSYLQLDADVEEYISLQWTRTGDGTFSATNILNPKYYPGPNDIASGNFTLHLYASPKQFCQVGTTESKTISIVDNPEAEILTPTNQLVCSDTPFNLSAQAESFDNLLWITSGDGTFLQPNSLQTTYIPGTNDIATVSNITLTIVAAPIAPCVVTAEDDIVVSFQRPPSANAGSDFTICEDQPAQLSGTADAFSAVLWESGGDGSFTSNTTINPVYTPGPSDIISGNVVLTFTAEPISPCAIAESDQISVGIQYLATANAGVNATICENSAFTLNGQAAHFTSVQWTTSGNGSFSNPGILNPVYNPSANDINTGQVVLTLTAQPVSPCVVSASDAMTLNIQKLSTASAGADAEICEGETHQLQGVVANASSLQWTSSGSGSFSNAGIINPVYTPSQADISSGSVTLILTAASVSPCAINAEDSMTLNIQQLATANAGVNATICENSAFTLNGQAAHFTSVQWTTSGNGSFSNPGILNPVYNPSANDINSGQVALTLTAQPVSPCVVSASDAMTLNIQKLSTASAGVDAEICEGETHQLQGVVANASSLQWTSSGSGSFSNTGIINPIYTPSQADINSGSVTLMLTAASVSPCAINAEDSMTLSIQQLATANAGANATICEISAFTLNGQAAHFTSVQWTTSGNGSFSNPGILNPVYNPSANDINSGQVALTLTAQPVSPCVVSASDAMTLNIQKLSTASAGVDAEICEGETHQLQGVVANASSLQWTSSGSGSFSNTGIINPVYTPSQQDIQSGIVNLTLVVLPQSPCAITAFDELTLTFQPLSEVAAGADAIICSGESLQLSGQAMQFESVEWSSNGSGTFSNQNILDPVYTPSTGDIAAGSVILTLTAQPLSPCEVSTSDQLILQIDEISVIDDLVENTEVLKGDPLVLSFEVQSLLPGYYSWYFNGELIEGVNSSQLIIQEADVTDAGFYQSVFTGDCGTLESNLALVEVVQVSTHQITIPEGWSGISSYVTPDDPQMTAVFSNIVNDLVLISDNSGVYWPGQNINTLGDWSATTGYRIKMENARMLHLAGLIRYPLDEISIPAGWSYLPVNSTCLVNVAAQFGGMSQITLIKDIAGTGMYWPAYGVNTLENLMPGKAYEIYNASGQPVNIKYPACDELPIQFEFKESINDLNHPWNAVHLTPASHVFGFSAQALDKMEYGDIVAVFTTEGICAGLMQVDDKNQMNVLTAFASDPVLMDKTGFVAGESVSFKLYRPSTNEQMELHVEFDEQLDDRASFTPNGISLIKSAETGTAGIDYIQGDHKLEVNVFPNPTAGQLNLSIESGSAFSGKLYIINASGQVVLEREISQAAGVSVQQIDISSNPRGVYYLRIVSDHLIKAEKIVLK